MYDWKICFLDVELQKTLDLRDHTGIWDVLISHSCRVPALDGLPPLSVRISNYNFIHEVWDKFTYPFPNFNGVAVEFWEWISKFILDDKMGSWC